MTLLKLVKYFDRSTVATLKMLLSLALKGELRGICVWYRVSDGRELCLVTGSYRIHAHALSDTGPAALEAANSPD